MTMLADRVDVVIGVDTHKHTHTATVVRSVTGAALETVTVPTDASGYEHLVELADRDPGVRVWAIEGTGTYGAGLTRHLHACGEQVFEPIGARALGCQLRSVSLLLRANEGAASLYASAPMRTTTRASEASHHSRCVRSRRLGASWAAGAGPSELRERLQCYRRC